MCYFCIYEVNKRTKETSFVDCFDECINDAQEFCLAMNNFSPEEVYYCVRCLDSREFKFKETYNPILFNSLIVVL